MIGAGAAGITMAYELARSPLQVVVLVGGGRRERTRDRDLYRGLVDPAGSHERLELNRRRGWGGTTALWGGRCLPLDPVDFEERPHVPYSGWPIGYADLLPHYRRANNLCEAGRFAYDVEDALPGAAPEMIAGFDGDTVVSTRLERWSPPTNFGRSYGRVLRQAPNLRVLLWASALRLVLSSDGGRVARVVAATAPGAEFSVEARDVVLAAGGLENPRLLLASNDVLPEGVGNSHGNVGRFYMSHVSNVVASVELNDPDAGFIFGFERDAEGVYVRRRLWVTPEGQASRQIGNAAAVFHRPDIADPSHGNSLFSSTYLAKTYIGALRENGVRGFRRALHSDAGLRSQHWRVLGRNMPRLAPDSVHLVQSRWLARRRLPMVLGQKTGRQFDLLVASEHTPNPNSRVTLGSDQDTLGMPRLCVHVAFSDLDTETVVGFFELVRARLTESRTGRGLWDSDALRAEVQERLAQFNSEAHHLGTTRMAARPEDGVVDADCRVHGVENLFVSGGSVFATSGQANPTLTIVALSTRLAAHLRSRT